MLYYFYDGLMTRSRCRVPCASNGTGNL